MMGEVLRADQYHTRKICQRFIGLRIELNDASIQSEPCESDYPLTEALSTKIGISFFAVMGLSSLRDELTG
jgi:hypothetical protein